MKKIFAIAVAAVLAVSANAQDCCQAAQSQCCGKGFTPSWFVQFQGGVQLPCTPGDKGDLLSPAFSLNLGRNINPLTSVRLGIEGVNSKVFNEFSGAEQEFKYATGSFDAMLNVTNLFRQKYCSPLNLFAFAGVGLNWSGMPTTNSSKFSPNVRVGAQLDYRVAKNLAINLEYRADNTNDQFNGRLTSGGHDWYQSVFLGVSLVLPDAKKVVDRTAEVNELNAKLNALRAELDELAAQNARLAKELEDAKNRPAEKIVENKTVLPNVFFRCAKTNIDLNQQPNVQLIADYMNQNPDETILITGYASTDGKNAYNVKLSAARAKAVADMLVKKYGIAADRISVATGGPTNEIYKERKLNRVAVPTTNK